MERFKSHIIVEILEYNPELPIIRTFFKKSYEDITFSSLKENFDLVEKTNPFEVYLQNIEGSVKVEIGDQLTQLNLGQSMVVPAHTIYRFHSTSSFKIISTIIKQIV